MEYDLKLKDSDVIKLTEEGKVEPVKEVDKVEEKAKAASAKQSRVSLYISSVSDSVSVWASYIREKQKSLITFELEYYKLHQQYKYIVAHCLMLILLYKYFRHYCHFHFIKISKQKC